LIDRRNYHLFQPLLNQVATGLLSPPLRERREDIPLLIRFFTQRYGREMNRVIEEIPAAPLEALTRYSWPGNIRELQTLVERSVILSPGPVLHIVVPDAVPDSDFGGPEGAAATLRLRRTTLQSRTKKVGIARHFR